MLLYADDENKLNRGMGVEQKKIKKKEHEKDSSKKHRIRWTPELHHKFERAFIALKSEEKSGQNRKRRKADRRTCTGKHIFELMDVPDVTKAQVQSHLQKYLDKKNRGTKRMSKNASNNNALPQQEVLTEPIRPQNVPQVPDAAAGNKAFTEFNINKWPERLTSWSSRDLGNRTQQPEASSIDACRLGTGDSARRPRQNSSYMAMLMSDDSIRNESEETLSTTLAIPYHDASAHHQAGDELDDIRYYERDEFISTLLSSPHRDANLDMLPQQHPILPAPPVPVHHFSSTPTGLGGSTNQSRVRINGESQGRFTDLFSDNFMEAKETIYSNFPETRGLGTNGDVWNGVPSIPLGQKVSSDQSYGSSNGTRY